jgi:hypothetical protein
MRAAALVRGRTIALEEREADSRILVWRSTPDDRALQGAAVNGRQCEEQRLQVTAAGWLASNLLSILDRSAPSAAKCRRPALCDLVSRTDGRDDSPDLTGAAGAVRIARWLVRRGQPAAADFTGGLGMRKSVAMIALGASVLLQLDPVELVVSAITFRSRSARQPW